MSNNQDNGNAAAMHDVLVKLLDAIKSLSRTHNGDLPKDVCAILGMMAFEANAALAAPPRVCDVNTLEYLSDFVEKTILASDLLKDTPEIVKSIVMASVRTALTVAYEPAKMK